MSANRFVLKHHQLDVEYTIGATPGVTALVYKDASGAKDFKVNEITTDKTALGLLVSVPLTTLPIEPGRPNASFGFFLPDADVVPGQTENVTRIGLTVQSTTGANARSSSRRCFELHGTAQRVAVPLEQPATR